MSTRTRLTRAESKARTRSELVEAGRRVFLERGYHGASLEAVADAAGFSTGAVYSAFDGKADLFLAVFDARVADRAHQLERAGANAASAAEQGADLAREFTNASRQERDWSILVIEFWVHAARNPELRRRFAQRHDALKAAIGRVIDQMLARTGERLSLDSEQLAIAAIALGNGLTLERLAHPDGVPDELFPTVGALIMEGLVRDAQEGAEP
ncbi:MAG: TetR/AcrR family transcriptional regulator [Acidimicrobiales bacterium]